MPGPERPTRTIQPPRPPNAWILFRSEMSRALPPPAPGEPRRPQAAVSKAISEMWQNAPTAVREEYERRARQKKEEHQLLYPDYRFTPMKKEDKERIREEKRVEKERDRGQSRKGRAKGSPSASTTAALAIPPTIYAPESVFGPFGPSPPISAASSPADSGPFSGSPATPVRASLPRSPLSQPAQVPADTLSPDSSTPTATPTPQDGADKTPQPSGSTWPDQGSATQENFVSFNVDMASQPWTQDSGQFEQSVQSFINATGDPSIFEMSNFDPSLLLSNPSGPIDVSIGDLPLDYFDFNAFLDSSMPIDNSVQFNPQMANLFSAEPPSGNTTYNVDPYANYDYSMDLSQSMLANPVSPISPISPVTQNPILSAPPPPTYVPPSGAAFSSSRRVGASWRPPRSVVEPDHATPRAWSLSAGPG